MKNFCVAICVTGLILVTLAVPALAGVSVEDSLMMPQLDGNGVPIDRWRVSGDFNLDGREDLLISEDIAKANDNGLYFAIYLRDSTGSLSFYDSFYDHPNRLCVESCGQAVRVWTYEYTGSGTGILAWAEITQAGLIPGNRVELHESGRVSQAILGSVFRNSDVKFKVQRSRVVAGKVQWVDDKTILSFLEE
ncbi:MAG: hypothetical protein IPH75_10550 [bacterium]|nr:hypothetical protein [bacterium]